MASEKSNNGPTAKNLVNIRLRLFEFAISHSLEEVLRETLDELEKLTQSSIGFYHFMESDQKTLSLQAWSTRTVKEFCKAEGKGMHYSIDQAGVWVDCVRQRRPVIHNDYASLAHRKGLPPGHAEVFRELVVPVMRAGRIMAIIGVGNKPTDYTEKDVEIVSYLADLTWEIAEHKKIDEKLYKEHEFSENLLNTAQAIIVVLDTNGNIIRINPFMEELSGYRLEDVKGREWFSTFLPEKDQEKVRVLFRKAIQNIRTKGNVNPIVLRDGSERYISWYDRTLKDKNGEVIGLLAIGYDITERRAMEEKLRQGEARLRLALDAARAGMWEWDLQTNENFWSDELWGLYGLEPHSCDPSYETWCRTIIPDDRAMAEKTVKEAAFSGHELNGEWRVRSREGVERWLMSRGRPLYDINGNIAKYVGIVIDITKRKQIEKALANEKERLAVTLRSIGDGVITSDLEGQVMLINEVAEGLTGWSQDEARGMPMADVFNIINEHTRKRCESPVDLVLKAGTIVGLANHTVLVARDGTEKIIADSGAPIRDVNGDIIGVVLVFRDITDRVKMEEELARTHKLESLGVLAGGIAHDFNNILTTLIGNVSLAKAQVTQDEEIFELLNEAEMASTRAQTLTKQLLTFAKGGAPVKGTASIRDLLKESSRFVLRGSKSRCDLSIPEDLWPVEIDVGQIDQVIHNIVLNGSQAMPEGGIIQVAARNIVMEKTRDIPVNPGKYVKISVTDHGVGIAEKHLSKIFDPYFTTKQAGSGLGLATTYSIIKKHNGYITVESQVGVGTAFYIYLPASEKAVPEEAETLLIKGKGKILVMDDEAPLRKIVGRVLTKLGYEAGFADDGSEAVRMYKEAKKAERPYDAVILDLTVPGGMGGKETIGKLLKIDPEVKAIVSSGYSDDPVLANFQKYGFKGMLPKPFESRLLGKVLHDVLKGEKE